MGVCVLRLCKRGIGVHNLSVFMVLGYAYRCSCGCVRSHTRHHWQIAGVGPPPWCPDAPTLRGSTCNALYLSLSHLFLQVLLSLSFHFSFQNELWINGKPSIPHTHREQAPEMGEYNRQFILPCSHLQKVFSPQNHKCECICNISRLFTSACLPIAIYQGDFAEKCIFTLLLHDFMVTKIAVRRCEWGVNATTLPATKNANPMLRMHTSTSVINSLTQSRLFGHIKPGFIGLSEIPIVEFARAQVVSWLWVCGNILWEASGSKAFYRVAAILV